MGYVAKATPKDERLNLGKLYMIERERSMEEQYKVQGTEIKGTEIKEAETKEMETESCCKEKVRDKEGSEYKDLIKRLNRIEGQVRGIRNMVEENRYCVDILTQVSAVSSALNAFNKVLLAEHMKSCVVEDIRNGQEEAVDELCALLQKLMK